MSDGRTVAHDVYMSVLVSCAKALFFYVYSSIYSLILNFKFF